jgi:hypothetical protein
MMDKVHKPCDFERYLAKHSVTSLEHPPYTPNFSLLKFFLLPQLKSGLKGQQFASVKEATSKVSRALTGIKKLFPGMPIVTY